jgi:diphosphomevalonate decarboxylase
MKAASSKAHANIALAKYWGKCDEQLNLPAVPSLSLTLDGLWTETTVCFDSMLPADTIELNGQIPQVTGKPLGLSSSWIACEVDLAWQPVHK